MVPHSFDVFGSLDVMWHPPEAILEAKILK
jgi:hypothetical protein